jgi:hypothetical protein
MRRLLGTIAVLAMTLMLGVGAAWAQAKVTVTREESKPQKVEVKAGGANYSTSDQVFFAVFAKNACISGSTSLLPQPGHWTVAFIRSVTLMKSVNVFLQLRHSKSYSAIVDSFLQSASAALRSRRATTPITTVPAAVSFTMGMVRMR